MKAILNRAHRSSKTSSHGVVLMICGRHKHEIATIFSFITHMRNCPPAENLFLERRLIEAGIKFWIFLSIPSFGKLNAADSISSGAENEHGYYN